MGTNTDAVGSMRSVALELVDVWFRYPGLSDYVLRGVNLKITNGLTVIVGENGSGKTTLLMIMAGLLRPERDKVLFNGMDIFKEIRHVRDIMGVVFQDPDDQLFNFTVYDEIAYTIRQMGFSEDYIRRRITEVSELLGIKHLLDRNPSG
jgi:cobalt/nickel transport system ATP-binding protein